MSLVAYADSSDDETSSDEDQVQNETKLPLQNLLNGHISDDDEYEDDSLPTSTSAESTGQPKKIFSLPPPTKVVDTLEEPPDEEDRPPVLAFDKLPKPKPIEDEEIVEEDDEFLHKKETPSEEEKPPPPPRIVPKKGPVKIMIPSLSEFKDLQVSKRATEKSTTNPASKTAGLLSLLPKPKTETVFEKVNAKSSTVAQPPKTVTAFVPDSVKNNAIKKAALKTTKQPLKRKGLVDHGSDSEGSDGEASDFFSLNSEQKLPEVSQQEINAMVAKKAAEMAKGSQKVTQMLDATPQGMETAEEEAFQNYPGPSSAREVGSDERAIQALVGSRAKRQKMEDINIVDLSANEVLPDKEEWLRTALASSTSYQPKGVLVDEEPAPGTRRKHQITYLAHQAKANELELQAMWAANRHTRRQTQGKYGF